MNKDIQTFIEREACEHWSQSNYKEVAEKAHSGNDMCKTSAMARKVSNSSFQAGAHFAISLFKWRKVSEGLPDVSECEDKKCDFLAKTDYGYDIVTYYDDPKFLVGWFANALRRSVTEWMPIPNND